MNGKRATDLTTHQGPAVILWWEGNKEKNPSSHRQGGFWCLSIALPVWEQKNKLRLNMTKDNKQKPARNLHNLQREKWIQEKYNPLLLCLTTSVTFLFLHILRVKIMSTRCESDIYINHCETGNVFYHGCFLYVSGSPCSSS